MTAAFLNELETIIEDRVSSSADTSYVRSLLDGGAEKCSKKFGEEAIELVIACLGEDDAALTAEAADVLFHLLVVLRLRGVPLNNVMEELKRRTGQSGLEEKAARGS